MPQSPVQSLPAAKRRPDGLPETSMLPLWRCIYQQFMARGQRWELPSNAGMVLVHLHVHPEDAEPAVLAEVTHFPRQTMTFVLDTLESRGLVLRAPHPSDRRRKRIELTSKGTALGARMLADLLAFETVALAAIPVGEFGRFKHAVQCYADTLARQNAEAGPLQSPDPGGQP